MNVFSHILTTVSDILYRSNNFFKTYFFTLLKSLNTPKDLLVDGIYKCPYTYNGNEYVQIWKVHKGPKKILAAYYSINFYPPNCSFY